MADLTTATSALEQLSLNPTQKVRKRRTINDIEALANVRQLVSPKITKSDPVATVLGITELLEEILVKVDTKTPLLSQRVCTTFRATITKSTRLQEAFSIKMTDEAPRSHWEGGAYVNPLLKKCIYVDSYGSSIDVYFLKNASMFWDGYEPHPNGDVLVIEYYETALWDGRDSPERVRGSWEKMLLVRPPVAYRIRCECHEWGRLDTSRPEIDMLEPEDFKTLGDLVRELTRWRC